MDVLKVDAEHFEWPMLESSFPFHLLRDHVKQITLEFHFWPIGNDQGRCFGDDEICIGSRLVYYHRWLHALETEGFILYDSHRNDFASMWSVGADNPINEKSFPCCFEVALVNRKWFHALV